MVLFDNTVSMETARHKSIRKYKNAKRQKLDRYMAKLQTPVIKK